MDGSSAPTVSHRTGGAARHYGGAWWCALAVFALAGCGWFEEEDTYRGFARVHYEMHARPESFETYVTQRRPWRDGEFFDCLDRHLSRLDRRIRRNIAACDDECGNDAVCELDCNTRLGTDFLEADEALITLEKQAIRGQASYANAMAAGRNVSDLLCFAASLARDVQGLPPLTCPEIWAEAERGFIRDYTCKFERYIWE